MYTIVFIAMGWLLLRFFILLDIKMHKLPYKPQYINNKLLFKFLLINKDKMELF